MTDPATLRRMGVWGATFVTFNSMIGAGIFGLPGKLDDAVGNFAPWLLIIAGLCVMLVALCYADLAARFDRSGGPQLYASESFGPFIGFQTGWLGYAARIAASAANATVLAAYAAAIWPVAEMPVALGAILFGVIINLFELKRVMAALGSLSMVKLVPLMLLVLLGVGGIRPEIQLPQIGAVEGVALAALYAFTGFETACIPAGETRDAKRSIPRALLLTVAFVTLLYVMIQFVYQGTGLGASDQPLIDLARMQMGDRGALLIGLTAVVSVLANITNGILTAPRLTAAMAEQGQIPAVFNRRLTNGAPHVSILAYGAIGLLLVSTGSFVFLAVVSSLTRLFSYVTCAAAVPVLDRRAGVVRVGRGMAVPALAILLCLWAAAQSSGKEWATFAAFFAAGTILFLIARRSGRADV
nr:APC family permease [uncultured Sphingomonas sp.]